LSVLLSHPFAKELRMDGARSILGARTTRWWVKGGRVMTHDIVKSSRNVQPLTVARWAITPSHTQA